VFLIASRADSPTSSCHPADIAGCGIELKPTPVRPGRTRTKKAETPERKHRSMSLVRQLQDYRLTTAEILYHLPDHPSVLQSFIWQDLDIAPRYPVLHKFLDFWKREIEGSLHSVRVASAKLVKPATVTHADALLRIH
jgi:uncharacterized protein Usg